ncbi:MAG: hypothetical protein V2I40_15520 [Desulfobacteraceae bacterium]|jgi:hypothetical protein|nr:hypothetical protein [Desulfobacteraceae bacterium]
MTDNARLLPVVQMFFEYDLDTAAHILEGMNEAEAADRDGWAGVSGLSNFAVMFQNALIA